MKLSLHDLKNVNTAIGMLYDADGKYKAGFAPEEFYNAILEDSLKYGDENYVHLKNAETVVIRKGQTKARFRRWSGLTPTLTPLREGIPPAPDKTASETLEIGNVFSFGRWSEYTDQISLSEVSEIIAERAVQYGELANQTKELYARQTWLSTPNEMYANFKDKYTIGFGDSITLDDLKFLTSRMRRMMVQPIGGKYNYICSKEFIDGLLDDPRVVQYMKLEQTTGKMFTTGEPFPLFNINFIPTMLDEFAYPDTMFPGVLQDASGKEFMRWYAIDNNKVYHLFIPESIGKKVVNGVSYLKDGSAVENMVEWIHPSQLGTLSISSTEILNGTLNDKVYAYTQTITIENGVKKYGALTKATTVDNSIIALMVQLPIHRGILFGADAIVKIQMEGVSDMPKIIIKELGTSGVADPLDQRQSVGFKVDGFGIAIKRPEAVCVTYGIPKNAEFAMLTASVMEGAGWTTTIDEVVASQYEPSEIWDDTTVVTTNTLKQRILKVKTDSILLTKTLLDKQVVITADGKPIADANIKLSNMDNSPFISFEKDHIKLNTSGLKANEVKTAKVLALVNDRGVDEYAGIITVTIENK